MAETIKGINVVIGSDTTGLSKALSDVNKKSKDIQSELKQVEKLLKLDPSNTELLAQKQKLLSDAVANTREKLDRLKAAQEQVNEQFAKGEISEGQYRAFQREIAKTEQELEKLEDRLKKSNPALEAFGAKAKEAGEKLQNIGDKVKNIGEGLTKGITAPILGVGAASIAAFSEVDKGLDTIITKTGATGKQFEELEKSFNNVFSSMPASAEQVGTAIGEVNTRFRVTGTELENLSKTFIQFAEINGTDLNNSIATTQKIMSQWGIDISKTDELLGLLTNEAQFSGVSIDKLMGSIQQNGAVLKQMGFSLEDSIAILGEFEQNGINAEVVITALRKAATNYAKDGKSLTQGLHETVNAIKNAKTEAQALQIATEVFGTKGAAEMTTAIREGRLELDKFGIDMEEFKTVVSDTFEATLDPPDQLKQSLNNLKIGLADLGSAIMKVAAPAIQFIGEKAKQLSDCFKGLDDNTKQIIVIIGLLAAALGPLLAIIGSIIAVIANLMTITGALGISIGALAAPIGIAIAAIAAIIAIGVLLYKNWDTIKAKAAELWNNLQKTFAGIKESIVNKWNEVMSGIKNVWNSIVDFITGLPSKMANFGRNIIQGLIDGIKDKINAVKDAMKNVTDAITGKVKSILGIHSPSRVMMEMGQYTGEGFALGIKSTISEIARQSQAMARAVNPSVAVGGISTNGAIDGVSGNIVIKPVIEVPLYLDGVQIARASAPYSDKIQGTSLAFAGRGRGLK